MKEKDKNKCLVNLAVMLQSFLLNLLLRKHCFVEEIFQHWTLGSSPVPVNIVFLIVDFDVHKIKSGTDLDKSKNYRMTDVSINEYASSNIDKPEILIERVYIDKQCIVWQ